MLGIIYAKTPSWKTWGLGHLQEREAEVKALENHLPAGYELSEDHINTIKEKLPPSLEKVGRRLPLAKLRRRSSDFGRERGASPHPLLFLSRVQVDVQLLSHLCRKFCASERLSLLVRGAWEAALCLSRIQAMF